MIFIDLLLLRRAAYRHVLTNRGPFLEAIAASAATPDVDAASPLGQADRGRSACCVRRPHRTGDEFLHHLAHELEEDFGISHATMQVEIAGGHECALHADEVV